MITIGTLVTVQREFHDYVEVWTGVVMDSIATSAGGIRYEILPNDDFPAKSKFKPWETLRAYDYEIDEMQS